MTVISISKGQIKASINTEGASLVGLSDNDFHLIEPNSPADLYPGSILAPWPNRIRDGAYNFHGKQYQLPINEVDRDNSLHGLVAYTQWQVINQSLSHLSLKYILDLPKIYPGRLEMNVEYKIINQKLIIKIIAKNIGEVSAPYGVSIHTYLVAGQVTNIDELSLIVPADKYLEVDEQRLLPITLRDVTNTQFDFRKSKKIGDLFIDHAFQNSKNQIGQVNLQNYDGSGVELGFGLNTKWIQIHTADRGGAINGRQCVAVEPMSCPPDAFNSKIDLIELAPGQSNEFELWIQRKFA